MKRKPPAISDAVLKEDRTVTATGALIGIYPLPPDRHALVIAVPDDQDIDVD